MYELSTLYSFPAELTRPVQRLLVEGKYDYVQPGISCIPSRCLTTGSQVRMRLLHFTAESVEPEMPYQTIALLGKSRPANLRELLLFGRRYPELQLYFPIFALPTERRTTSAAHDVPFLHGHRQKGRWLQLRWPVLNWTSQDRFLIIQ